MLTPQERKVIYIVAIGATVVMLSSMLLCACGAGLGFLGGAAKALMQGGSQ